MQSHPSLPATATVPSHLIHRQHCRPPRIQAAPPASAQLQRRTLPIPAPDNARSQTLSGGIEGYKELRLLRREREGVRRQGWRQGPDPHQRHRGLRGAPPIAEGEGGVKGRKEGGNGQGPNPLRRCWGLLGALPVVGGQGCREKGGREGPEERRKGQMEEGRGKRLHPSKDCLQARGPEGYRASGGDRVREGEREGGREHKFMQGREGGTEGDGRHTRAHAWARVHGCTHGHIYTLLGTQANAFATHRALPSRGDIAGLLVKHVGNHLGDVAAWETSPRCGR